MNEKSHRILIIGQGLAGTCLGWRLLERGVPFLIADRDEPLTSSKVAAGLVTPITGMRLSLNWRYDSLHPEAVRFFCELERKLGGAFYFDVPHVRLFKNEKERELWAKRKDDDTVSAFVTESGEAGGGHAPVPLVDEAVFANPLGGFQQKSAGYLDTAAFLEASRRHFESLGCWMRCEVAEDDVVVKKDAVEWQGRAFGTAVFCRGWEGARSRWFSWAPFESARGTVLSLRAVTNERRIVNRGCWLLPRADGELKAGPTYELEFDKPNAPSLEAVEGLKNRIRSLLRVPFEITGSQTAVRPIIKKRQALIGRHPAESRIAFFNGLGSKGVLRAPFMARRLAEHLLDGSPLEAEYDLQANL